MQPMGSLSSAGEGKGGCAVVWEALASQGVCDRSDSCCFAVWDAGALQYQWQGDVRMAR